MKKLSVIFALGLFACGKSSDKSEIKIGTQIWMTKNLDESMFKNGDIVPEARTKEEWDFADNNQKPAWCYYDNDSTINKVYGKLYNWYAVSDERGLAPEGWHIATNHDFYILFEFLGNDSLGTKMKSKNGWDKSSDKNPNGTNESGFSVLPGGERGTGIYSFASKGREANFWVADNDNLTVLRGFFTFASDSYSVNSFGVDISMAGNGFSVRCVKDIESVKKSGNLLTNKNGSFEGHWVADVNSQVYYSGERITEIIVTRNGDNFIFEFNKNTNMGVKTMGTVDQSNNISLYGGQWLVALDVTNKDNLFLKGDIFHKVK